MEKTNKRSIYSLILGLISILLPFIGLILSAFGIIISCKSVKEINNSKEKGLGFAKSGRVVSIIGICYQLFIILALILFVNVKAIK
ncbi:DUF4190 domain-containing protein [Clostridium sp. C2-6-12]|uniref:DUF4190 domain-containing protein n=1 Tax=Clostridium sp. C2-6-12 TaxID=2698832 RepID=UPI00136EEEC7|nr:DUF4190 domain-containing protein [Clostridium sp. C2-6-12]